MKRFIVGVFIFSAGFFMGRENRETSAPDTDEAQNRMRVSRANAANKITHLTQKTESSHTNSFAELLSLIQAEISVSEEERTEAALLAGIRMTRMIPQLSSQELVELYYLHPHWVLLHGKKLQSPQKLALQEHILVEFAHSQDPNEYYAENLSPFISNLQPLNQNFLNTILESEIASFEKRLLLRNEFLAITEARQNPEEILDSILKNVPAKEHRDLLNNYLESLAVTQPQEALETHQNLIQQKLHTDPHSRGLSSIISQTASKDLGQAIELVNRNPAFFEGKERDLSSTLAYSMVDKNLDNFANVLEKIESKELQQEVADSAYRFIQINKSPEDMNEFLTQLKTLPDFLSYMSQRSKAR